MTKMNHEQLIQSLKIRLSSHSTIQDDCIIWNGCINERGYGIINAGREIGTLLAHRASWLVHHGSSPTKLVLHICDVRNCINIRHLKEGTCQDNTDDMMAKKRYRMPTHHKGSKNGMAVLNEELVLKIKSSLMEGKSVAEVSRTFQQPFTRIYDIKRERNWKHIMSEVFNLSKYKFKPAIGEKASGAKLNESQVIEIKRLLATGELQRKIAEKFNLSKHYVSNINTGKYWSHLSKE